MKGKVLPWPLFIDTAKAPEHFTESTFSAAEGCRAKGMGTAGELWSGEGTGLWERRHLCSSQICPLYEGLETTDTPPLSPLVVKINSTTRRAEHTRPYSQYLPKLLQKQLFYHHQMLPDCPAERLVQSWQIHGHFSRKQRAQLKVSPDQWWRRTKTHWFPPLPSSTSHRHDFILKLLQRPEGMSFVLVDDHQQRSQQGQKYKAYLESFCLCAGSCHCLD